VGSAVGIYSRLEKRPSSTMDYTYLGTFLRYGNVLNKNMLEMSLLLKKKVVQGTQEYVPGVCSLLFSLRNKECGSWALTFPEDPSSSAFCGVVHCHCHPLRAETDTSHLPHTQLDSN
jgi:hypothetical protein